MPHRHESLSQREKEIAACVIHGLTNKQITNKLVDLDDIKDPAEK